MQHPVEYQTWTRIADEKYSEHARWLGIIAGQGAILESEIGNLFWALLRPRTNHSEIIYYAMISLPPRLNIIQSLVTENFANESAEDIEIRQLWSDLRREIDVASGERNRCIHAIWAENPQNGNLQRRTTHSNGKFERRRVDLTVDELRDVATKIARVAGNVGQLSVRIVNRSPT